MTEIVETNLACEICIAKFGSKLFRDIINGLIPFGRGIRISCLLCKNNFDSHAVLRDHHMLEHNLDLFKEVRKFSNTKEFEAWKSKKEENFHCMYRLYDHLHNDECNQWIYICNDSWSHSLSQQNRKRKLDDEKPREVCVCASTIELVEDVASRKMEATVYTPHIHDPLVFTFLTADENALKSYRAGKVTIETMFDEIRDNIYGTRQRMHIPNPEEVKKMQRRFSVQSKLYFDDDDRVSVDIWANNIARLEDQSPVVYYKPQGTLDENSPSLSADDFVMILMSPFQSEILLEFGKNIVCIDCIRGTPSFNFSLTTFSVASEKGEVLPVSYLISNTIDENILTHYFSILSNQSGTIQPKILMTNDHPIFYQSWTNVLPKPHKHFITAWHVDQNWRKQLQKVKVKVQTKAQVYKAIRILLELSDEKMFSKLLGNVMREFLSTPALKVFTDYFKLYYMIRTEHWAFCYRRGMSFNTNMLFEAFHRFIKQIYIESRKINRVDGLVDALMKLTKDKLFARFGKARRQKLLADNYDNHYRSKVIRKEDTYQVYNDVWLVHSANRNLDYVVHKEDDCNQKNCELKCMQCNVCVHTYSCTCPYYYMNFSICKHIHAICNVGSTGSDNGFANINNLLSYTVKSVESTADNQPNTSGSFDSENPENSSCEDDNTDRIVNGDVTQDQISSQTNSGDLVLNDIQDNCKGKIVIISNTNLNNEICIFKPDLASNGNISGDNVYSVDNNESPAQKETETFQSAVNTVDEIDTSYDIKIENPTSDNEEVPETIVPDIIDGDSVSQDFVITQATMEENKLECEEYYVTEDANDHPTSENYFSNEEVQNDDAAQYYEYGDHAEVKERIQQKIEFIRECLMKNTYDYRVLIKVERELDRVLKLFGSHSFVNSTFE